MNSDRSCGDGCMGCESCANYADSETETETPVCTCKAKNMPFGRCCKADREVGRLRILLDRARYNLLAASNYVDALGGASQGYRQLIAEIDALEAL